MVGPDRRRFLSQLLGGAAATLATPAWLQAAEVGREGDDSGGSWNGWSPGRGPESAGRVEDEAYWSRVKEQFPLAPGLILMNAANLCPSPYPVQEAVFGHTRDVDRDASFQNRGKFGALKEEARAALADYVGASPSEIAITRNTSEGNNTVVNGLELGPGDEVVLWDQNHPTNNVSWDVRAKRRGFTVRRCRPPLRARRTPESGGFPVGSDQLPDPGSVLQPRVQLVGGGPCRPRSCVGIARGRGILTLVDGAQSFGALKLDLHDMGCDFFTASSHKWFIGPKEAGLMYVREESQERLWPSDVGVGWEGAETNGAQKFENMGQRDDAAVVSMATAAAFHEAIGPAAVQARVHALASAVKEGLVQGGARSPVSYSPGTGV